MSHTWEGGWKVAVRPGDKTRRAVDVVVVVWFSKSRQHPSVFQGWICWSRCCRSSLAIKLCYLTQLQYTDTELISLSTDPAMPGALRNKAWLMTKQSHRKKKVKIPSYLSSVQRASKGKSTHTQNASTNEMQCKNQKLGITKVEKR